MVAGLFGKLPSKRDFVAARARRRFLDTWEPWLQGGLAESRAMLGEGWVEAYNRAPIWRYWLAADLCGEPILGAFMPSVDGVGRAFPLTLFSGEGADPAPPDIDGNIAWFDSVETILLDALVPAMGFDAIERAAAGLSPPISLATAPLSREGGTDASEAWTSAFLRERRRAPVTRSFWWTIGGEDFPPLVFAAEGMPSADRFAGMLTGEFAAEASMQEGNARGD